MACFNFIPYDGEMWSYVFLNADLFGISDRDRCHLIWNCVDFHKKEQDSRDIKGRAYEGRLKREKNFVFGTLAGTLVRADLDTPRGKREPKIVILDRVNHTLN